jgi:hypothetical protein
MLVSGSIIVHYEVLRFASTRVARMAVPPRVRLWLMLGAAILSHLTHVLLFGIGFFLIEYVFASGGLKGLHSGNWEDAFYFAITSYTTLGIGDVYPSGEARLMSGIAALTGLVMVTWTASLTYLYMERYWGIAKLHGPPD